MQHYTTSGPHTRHYAEGTSITQTFPFGLNVQARALCPDGKVRAAIPAATADTFFSIPARVRVRGKTVSGFLIIQTEKEFSTPGPAEPLTVKFIPNSYGKNAGAFDN